MELLSKPRVIHIGSSSVEIRRNENGVVEIHGDDPLSIQSGIGYAHAHDRLMQLFITRILAQGRICEFFVDTDEAFGFDVMLRKFGFRADVKEDIANLTPETLSWTQSYCDGINAYIERHGSPLICKLLKIKPHPWTVSDVMLVMKLQMYLGLAQIQEHIERFIIQAIHDGVSVEKLRQLFSPHLDALDPSLVLLIKKARLERPYLHEKMEFMPGMSNNWALRGEKSASGLPLVCSDPHLQINRLPSIWYEVVAHMGEEKRMGATSPGFPGIVIGRSNNLSVALTYGMMDGIDFFIEEVKEGHCLRPQGAAPMNVREEIIQRKKEGESRLYFFESDAGVIECRQTDHGQIEDGFYFALNWSAKEKGASPTLNALANLWSCKTVKEAQHVLREATFSFNWVLADQEGNIGYQQSGRVPARKHSGLFPLPAWEEGALWNGFVPSELLASEYNPERGFVASANDDKNQPGKPLSISVPFARYRFERICNVLSEKKKFTIEDMKALQCDLYSIQAELFMNQIRDLIPDTEPGRILKEWDLYYSAESKGATLFEEFYYDLIIEVFGKVFGIKAWELIVKRHSLLVFTHGLIDRILLSNDESWFGEEGKTECLRRILEKSLSRFPRKIPAWGEKSQFRMEHLFFEGKLPKQFSKGPYPLAGSRATLAAAMLFREHKRRIAVGASYRFITDLGTQEAYTALCGGVTEGRFSKFYVSDVPLWLAFDYKKLD